MAYANGQIPQSRMVELGRGRDKYGLWKHLLPAGTAARWRWMVAKGAAKYGVTLRITPGWNAYRPLGPQKVYRAELGIYAAVPGTSSHGGWFNGREAMAIDVENWKDLAPGNERLAWGRFVALCKAAGFTVNFVSPQELWHIGDLSGNVWAAPAKYTAKPVPKPDPLEGSNMAFTQSTDTKDWLLIDTDGMAPTLRIPYGKVGSENQKRALAHRKVSGPALQLGSLDLQRLMRDNANRRIAFFEQMGLQDAIDRVTAEIAELIAAEESGAKRAAAEK